MHSNTLHGYWNRCGGFGRELWGEVTGNEKLFNAGLHQRMIGRLESYQGMNQIDAEQQIEQFMPRGPETD